MLRTAGHIDRAGPGEACDETADSRAGVPGRADVGVFEHDVTKAAHGAVGRRFRLGEYVDQTIPHQLIGNIAKTEPDAAESV